MWWPSQDDTWLLYFWTLGACMRRTNEQWRLSASVVTLKLMSFKAPGSLLPLPPPTCDCLTTAHVNPQDQYSLTPGISLVWLSSSDVTGHSELRPGDSPCSMGNIVLTHFWEWKKQIPPSSTNSDCLATKIILSEIKFFCQRVLFSPLDR